MKQFFKTTLIALLTVTTFALVGCSSKSDSEKKADDANGKIARMNEIAAILNSKGAKFSSTDMYLDNPSETELNNVETLIEEYVRLGDEVLAIAGGSDVYLFDQSGFEQNLAQAKNNLAIVKNSRNRRTNVNAEKAVNSDKIKAVEKLEAGLAKEKTLDTKILSLSEKNEESANRVKLFIDTHGGVEFLFDLAVLDAEQFNKILDADIELKAELNEALNEKIALLLEFQEIIKNVDFPEEGKQKLAEGLTLLRAVIEASDKGLAVSLELKNALVENMKAKGLNVDSKVPTKILLPVYSI